MICKSNFGHGRKFLTSMSYNCFATSNIGTNVNMFALEKVHMTCNTSDFMGLNLSLPHHPESLLPDTSKGRHLFS